MAKASFFLRQKSDNGIGLDQKKLNYNEKETGGVSFMFDN